MTTDSTVRYAVSGAVATITLNRPGSANALDRRLKEELLAALRAADNDDNVRAVVLTGAGKAFCVGQDLDEHAEALHADRGSALDTVREHYNPITTLLAELAKPVIAAVNGPCVGAGLGFALAADLRVAASSAKFGTAFTGIGFASDSGLSASLVRAVGSSRASELFLLGEMIPAQRALDWGLVYRVVDPEALPDAAADLADQLANGPTAISLAISSIKLWRHQHGASSLVHLVRQLRECVHHIGLTKQTRPHAPF